MRIGPVLAILFLVTASVSASASATKPDWLIIPGRRIGPALLGMSQYSVEVLNAVAECPVTATYDTRGRAARLVTSTGGACGVTGEIQVGRGAGPILTTFGLPDEIKEDVPYPQATAYWLSYTGLGISFRILVMRNGSNFTQAIAVFPRTASSTARSCLPHLCSEPLAIHW